MRFSDEELTKLNNKLDTHIKEYDAHMAIQDERWGLLLLLQESNAKNIAQLTLSTKGLVDTWTATTTTVKVLQSIGKLFTWLASFTLVAAGIKWLAKELPGMF